MAKQKSGKKHGDSNKETVIDQVRLDVEDFLSGKTGTSEGRRDSKWTLIAIVVFAVMFIVAGIEGFATGSTGMGTTLFLGIVLAIIAVVRIRNN